MDQFARSSYEQLTDEAKDILYYIVHRNDGRASFRDLLGHTDLINQILSEIRRVTDGISLLMIEVDSFGFTILPVYVEQYKELFATDVANGNYSVPQFTRTPMF